MRSGDSTQLAWLVTDGLDCNLHGDDVMAGPEGGRFGRDF